MKKTRVEIIHQVLPIKVGDNLREGDIDRCRIVLERLLLFRTAFVNVKPGAEKGKAILVVYVQEKRFGDLGVSLEYSELDGFWRHLQMPIMPTCVERENWSA